MARTTSISCLGTRSLWLRRTPFMPNCGWCREQGTAVRLASRPESFGPECLISLTRYNRARPGTVTADVSNETCWLTTAMIEQTKAPDHYSGAAGVSPAVLTRHGLSPVSSCRASKLSSLLWKWSPRRAADLTAVADRTTLRRDRPCPVPTGNALQIRHVSSDISWKIVPLSVICEHPRRAEMGLRNTPVVG